MNDNVVRWRAREDAALEALLRESGVTDEQIEKGGPDGQEIRELVFAPVETWNAFGLIAQQYDDADDDVHEQLLDAFVIDVDEDDEWYWNLRERTH